MPSVVALYLPPSLAAERERALWRKPQLQQTLGVTNLLRPMRPKPVAWISVLVVVW
jgi:hypothetical protein